MRGISVVESLIYPLTISLFPSNFIGTRPGGSRAGHSQCCLLIRNDNSKGNAKSAGAGIRRYNELALQQDIHEIMLEWKPLIAESDLVFVHVSARNQSMLFIDSVLDSKDPRIRRIPFTTYKPTHGELVRCYEELTNVHYEDYDPQETLASSKESKEKEQKEIQREKNVDRPKTHLIATLDPIENEISPLDEDTQVIVDRISRGKLEALKKMDFEDVLNEPFHDSHGTTFLHVAASSGQAEIVKYLLELGAGCSVNLDPTIKTEKKSQRPYDVASSKEVRDAFRRFMAEYPDHWDYKLANVPGPLTAEMEMKQKEKEREKRKKERERKKAAAAAQAAQQAQNAPAFSEVKVSETARKLGRVAISRTEMQSIGMTPEQRARLDREKRALAAESRMKSQKNQCAACGVSLAGKQPFEKSVYKYCSMACLQTQRILFD